MYVCVYLQPRFKILKIYKSSLWRDYIYSFIITYQYKYEVEIAIYIEHVKSHVRIKSQNCKSGNKQ